MRAVISNAIQFLRILLLRDRVIQVQACLHCSKGSQVPEEVLDEKPDLNKAAELLLLGQSMCF